MKKNNVDLTSGHSVSLCPLYRISLNQLREETWMLQDFASLGLLLI